MNKPHHTPRARCPYCGQARDGAVEVYGDGADEPPEAGDFTLCVACGGISVFTNDATLRMLDEAVDRPTLEGDPELAINLVAAQRDWEKAHGK
jgi:hypothetical protein